jgi:hypothetical protein
MVAEQVDISKLNISQRLRLMERLWCSLSGELEKHGSPVWHDEELATRSIEWVNRESVSEDWHSVREELKRLHPKKGSHIFTYLNEV